MIGYARAAVLSLGLACVTALTPALCQAQGTASTPAMASAKQDDRASAYYAFAMAHLNGELASAYGNRGEYVNKAIDSYKLAMKLDPNATYIGEELADFYAQVGQVERATQLATELVKAHPESVGAHKILGKIYAKQIGDPEQGQQPKIDQTMLKAAIAEYQKITELDPKDSESLSQLARLDRVAKDEAGAEKAYHSMLSADPNDEEALTGLAILNADRGDIAGAIALLKPAAEKNPDGRLVTTLAELYESDKQYSNAADAWKEALPLTNDNVQVLRHYATNLYAADRAPEALTAFQKLAEGDPKNPELQLQLVELLERTKDFAGAHAALAKAQALSSGPEVRLAEAELLSTEGKSTEAIAVLQNLLGQTKKTTYQDAERVQRIQILEMLGTIQRKAEKTQDAMASFRQIAELNPQAAPGVEVEVIETLLKAKDYKGAKTSADSALKKFPTNPNVMMAHASVLGENGQYDAAIAEFRAMPNADKSREILIQVAQLQEKARHFADERKTLDVVEANSTTPEEKQALVFMRGEMFDREKNYDSAEQEFRKVLQTDPRNATALNYLGYMFADRGVRLDEALQLITKALEIEPGNGAFLDSLGWVYFHQNRLDQAADQLRQALDKIGQDATVHDHLGDVYFKQGKIREAIQQWEASVSQMKSAAPSEQDNEELVKVTKKLDTAKVRVAQKQ